MSADDSHAMDIHEIRMLKHRYCACADACATPGGARHAAALAALFAEDGVWTSPERFGGHFEGPKAIQGFFEILGQSAVWAQHMVLNDIITVTGARAQGRWKSIIPVNYLVDGKVIPHWIFGGYEDDYVKHDGVWRIQTLRALVYQAGAQPEGAWGVP